MQKAGRTTERGLVILLLDRMRSRMSRGLGIRSLVGVGFAALLVACSLTRDLDYLGKGNGSDGGGGPSPVEVKDASAPPAIDAATNPCPFGNVIRPKEVIADYAVPLTTPDSPQAIACDSGNVLDEDGKTANLDRQSAAEFKGKAAIAQQDVAGCVAVRFDDAVSLRTISVKLGPVADGCGASPCTPNDPENGCGSNAGRQALVFAGPTLNDLHVLAHPRDLPDALITITAATADNATIVDAHYVVVCRGGTISVARDDIGVDAIWAHCP